MATATPKKFAIQQIFELLLRKPDTKEIIAYLEDVKTSNLENTAELVFPTGGRGNVYIGRGFSHSKRATLNVEMATWNTTVMAAQNGTELVTGAVSITEKEVIAVSGGNYYTKFAPQGTAGAEIGYAYLVGEDGSLAAEFKQGTTATTGVFTYSGTTKMLTFSAGDKTLINSGSIMVAYTRLTDTNAQQLTISGKGIPDTALVTAYGLAADICSGVLYPCQIDGLAQISPEWNFDLSADGDPAVQGLNMEFLKTCQSDKLYTFTVYTEDVPSA